MSLQHHIINLTVQMLGLSIESNIVSSLCMDISIATLCTNVQQIQHSCEAKAQIY